MRIIVGYPNIPSGYFAYVPGISFLLWGYIRGASDKYPTCVQISALVLFFVVRTVASLEVVPIWLNHTLPAVPPHLKAVLERRFWNGLWLARRITPNRLDVVEPLSFERHFQFWEHPEVAGSYVGTVRRLAKLYNLVFRQKYAAHGSMNAPARYRGEEASHRLTRNAVVFFSRHHAIFSEHQRNILCWSSDPLEQIRSAQHPHNRKK